ncbi:MAG TPA: hypothetical protein VGF95_04155 [Solirubrobacteraceae bacterium]|jgi:hypothetical protein
MNGEVRLNGRALLAGLAHDWPIVRGALVPLLGLAIAWIAGASTKTAAGVAVFSAVAALIAIELLVGLRARAGVKGLLLEGCVGVGLGVAVLALRVMLH